MQGAVDESNLSFPRRASSSRAEEVLLPPLGSDPISWKNLKGTLPKGTGGGGENSKWYNSETGTGGVKTYRTLEGGGTPPLAELAPKVAPRRLGLLTPNWRFSIESL